MSRRAVSVSLMLAIVVAGGVSLLAFKGSSANQIPIVRPKRIPRGATVLTVGAAARTRPIPSGFLGLSLEYPAVEAYAGRDPGSVDPALAQLIRNLGPSPVLRIGGDSTDWTWWPVSHMRRPPGVRYTLGARWAQVTRALARAIGARLILGLNLEADSTRVAVTEARALIAGLGADRIAGLELGNEPELYGSFGWYRTRDGREVPGRPPGYDFPAFTRDFARVGGALPRFPLAGPATGSQSWMRYTQDFVASEPLLRVVTLHRYPLQLCYMPAASPLYPTVSHLLAPAASRGLADSVARYARLAHAHGLTLRIDEMNSVSCGGAPGISNAFASALWALDALFEMARVGVDGVNVHTFPRATYQLFSFERGGGAYEARVYPEYYGLLMFAQAAPAGSRLLHVSRAGGPTRAWATRGTDGRTRVVLINVGSRARTLAIRANNASGNATVERLEARGVQAKAGVTLGGRSFGRQTATGMLAGRSSVVLLAPVKRTYVIRLRPASAVLLTIP
jgi:hypothetical protein